jgi:hypothetical protein
MRIIHIQLDRLCIEATLGVIVLDAGKGWHVPSYKPLRAEAEL